MSSKVTSGCAAGLIDAAQILRTKLARLKFPSLVSHVYCPLDYAWEPYQKYLEIYGNSRKRVLFLGMNPGPFGMVQTGIPFGEISAVRDWMRIQAPVKKPRLEHPRRPILGFECPRSEISGFRLWGLFAARFPDPKDFFDNHFVLNFCPLAFLSASGSNLTPDKLASELREQLCAPCDQHLVRAVDLLEPEYVIGIGDFAAKRIQLLFRDRSLKLGRILHPSPASPAANRDWAGTATSELKNLGIW